MSYQSTPPKDPQKGDMWCTPADMHLYWWSGSRWRSLQQQVKRNRWKRYLTFFKK